MKYIFHFPRVLHGVDIHVMGQIDYWSIHFTGSLGECSLLISELIKREFSHKWNVIEGHHFSHYKQASLIGNIRLRQLWDVCLTLIIEYILIWMLIAAKPDRKACRWILHRITESLQLIAHINQIISSLITLPSDP